MIALILVGLTTVKLAKLPPMVTDVAPAKLLPVIVMVAPPAGDPTEVETLVTVGADGIVPPNSNAPILGACVDRV